VKEIRRAGFPIWQFTNDGPLCNEVAKECLGNSEVNIVGDNKSPLVGVIPTYRLALGLGVESTFFKYDRFVVFQDDVAVTEGLHDYLDSQTLPSGVLSLYTPTHRHVKDRFGWHKVNLKPTEDNPLPWMDALGGCAILWEREIAKAIIESDPPIRTDRLGWWISEWCYHNGVDLWTHCPSFVQHVGEESVRGGIGLTPERVAGEFLEKI
jgi:hypothetical protein